MTVALDTHTIHTARIVGVTGSVAIGSVLVLNTAGDSFVVSTSANRTSTGRRSAGIAKTAGDATNPYVQIQYVGIVPNSVTGLGTGTATTVYVNSSGVLARGGSSSDDIVGRCDTDGTAYLVFGGMVGSGSPLLTAASPTNSVQYNNAGAFGGATNVAISSSGDLEVGVSTGSRSTFGDIRGASGGVDGAGFAIGVRDGAGTGNLVPIGVFNVTGSGDVLAIGGGQAWGYLAASVPDIVNVAFNTGFLWAWETLTPQSHRVGVAANLWTSAGPIGGWNYRRGFTFDRHTNVIMWGTRTSIPNAENALGTGEGVFSMGRSDAVTSTAPDQGFVLECPSSDLPQYRTSGNKLYPLWDGPQKVVSTTGTINNQSTLDTNSLPARVLEFTGAGTITLNGLDNGREGRSVFLIAPPSDGEGGTTLVIANQAAGSTAANRICTPGANTYTVGAGGVWAVYDTTASRWRLAGEDVSVLGQTTEATQVAGSTFSADLDASGSYTFAVDSNEYFKITTTEIFLDRPLRGEGSAMRFQRVAITYASANYTLGIDERNRMFLTLGGTTGGARDLICPDEEGSLYNILNSTADTITVKKSGGTGFTIASGAKAWAFHNGTDYEAR